MLEHFFKSLVATVSDPYQCNRITDALAAAGIKFYCKSKDVNRHNTFDQARIGTLGIKPRYVTEVFVDKENADMALHIIHTLSQARSSPANQRFRYKKGRCRLWVRGCSILLVSEGEWSVRSDGSQRMRCF